MLTSAGLKAAEYGGLINEDVMQEIWDISSIPLPFADRIGSDGTDNSYTEWTIDALAAPDVTNAVVDGADTTGLDNSGVGERVGNQHQISVKVVKVSTRARESDSIGTSDQLAYQVMMRQRELRRDVEAIKLNNQGSVADDGTATAGKLGGFSNWLTTNTFRGATGSDGGFSSGVVGEVTPGTKRALSETMVRDACQAVYEQGGDPSVLMSIPAQIRKFSEYMFTDQAKIATLQSDTGQSNEAARAKGAVSVFLTDFGISLEYVANRLQQKTGAGSDACDVFIFDPMYVREGLLHGYRVEPLAKTGLAEQRQMAVDHTLKVLNEAAHAVIADIDFTAAVVA